MFAENRSAVVAKMVLVLMCMMFSLTFG